MNHVAPSPAVDTPGIMPATRSSTHALYWSIRRELWENRSLYVAPLAVTAVVLFGFLIRTMSLPGRMRAVMLLGPARQEATVATPFDIVAMLVILTTFIVGVFYSLGALHGERRDRSVLFWKSLPVSDVTTVLSKACIPLVILPLLTFAIITAAQTIMLLVSSAVMAMSGLGISTIWTHWNFFHNNLILLYGLVALALWHSPIYSFLLLVSGWSRRAAVLWAVLPALALVVLERVAFNSSHLGSFLGHRLMGHLSSAYVFNADGTITSPDQITPARFLARPGLWGGLAFAAMFLAASVRMRRYREPN